MKIDIEFYTSFLHVFNYRQIIHCQIQMICIKIDVNFFTLNNRRSLHKKFQKKDKNFSSNNVIIYIIHYIIYLIHFVSPIGCQIIYEKFISISCQQNDRNVKMT
jgi:hypothetical protein